jgi:hypothetical protein
MDENGDLICAIKISHGKKTDKGVVAHSAKKKKKKKKTEQEFKQRGWQWPPKKK